MSCLRILSRGGQIPSDDEVDKGQECVSELQAGDWSPQSVPLSLWMIFMPPWCHITDKIPDLPCPPDEIPVPWRSHGAAWTGWMFRPLQDCLRFSPRDFKILKPLGGLKLIYKRGEEKKNQKCVWSIELPLTSKVPTMLFSSTLQQSGHPANP